MFPAVAPHCTSPSNALCSSRSVIKELNRETTMAKCFPPAFSLPSSAFDPIFPLHLKSEFPVLTHPPSLDAPRPGERATLARGCLTSLLGE
jgi:hypothetical protein